MKRAQVKEVLTMKSNGLKSNGKIDFQVPTPTFEESRDRVCLRVVPLRSAIRAANPHKEICGGEILCHL